MEISFEISPMQNQQKVQSQRKVIDQLYALKPDYISCSINGIKDVNFKRNFELCKGLKADNQTVPMANFSIGGKKNETLMNQLDAYLSIGVDHYFVLRGDFQYQKNSLFPQNFSFIETIKSKKSAANVAVTGYPESHIFADSTDSDIQQLKRKQEYGADKVITQICYDRSAIAEWLDNCAKKGVCLPVDIGILPVINKKSILQICLLNGISIPHELSKIIGRYGDDADDFKKAGIEYTCEFIESFNNLRTNGFHFFSGNNVKIVNEIINRADLK